MKFTKQEVEQKHREKVTEILMQCIGQDAIEALVGYIMNRISNVISYERSKMEHRLMCYGSNENGKVNQQHSHK